MELAPETQFVVYNGLTMQVIGGNALFNDDDGAIIDWLSRYNYPREMLAQATTTTVVFHRLGKLDLILVNNYGETDGKGLTVHIWLDFIGNRTDLRKLDRPYNTAHKDHYEAIWNYIELQIIRLADRFKLPPISFSVVDEGQHKPHYRYANGGKL